MAETAIMTPSAVVAAPAAQLARLWFMALAVSEDERPGDPDGIHMDAASGRAFLGAQSAAVLAILLGRPFRPRQAAAVGQALVQADFVSADVLGRSLRVLILRLPELLGEHAPAEAAAAFDLERRVAAVTEAIANGYVRALRDRTLAEQESVMRAELDAQRTISDQLRYQATHDPLTGLPNRAAVFGRLSVDTRGRPGHPGRPVLPGPRRLQGRSTTGTATRRATSCSWRWPAASARRPAPTARSPGAWAATSSSSSPRPSAGIPGMIALAAAILGEVSRPIPLRIGRVCISACAGIAECPAGSLAPASLIADADAALYVAKARGSGRWAVYGASPDGEHPQGS